MNNIIYSIKVENRSGATDGFVGTKDEINAWLNGWSDPQNLAATIYDENGCNIAYKSYGRKTILWPEVA